MDLTENRGPEIAAVTTALLVLAVFAVSLRCYVRAVLTKSFAADDWLMVVSLVVFILDCSMVFAALHYGMGRHMASLAVPDMIEARKYQSLATLIYIANVMFLKLSIAAFLLRIAVQKVYVWILKISMAIVGIWFTAHFVYDLFQCTPVERQWDFTITTGHCVSRESIVAASYALTVLSISSDFLYALLPILMLWKVNMSVAAKVSVIGVLSLGIFASIAPLIRARYLNSLSSFDDILYTTTDAMIWTIIEPCLGMVAASIATLRPLMRAMRIPGFSSVNSRATRQQARSAAQGPYIRQEELGTLPSSAGTGTTKKMGVRTAAVGADEISEDGSEEMILEDGRRRHDIGVGV